MSSMFEKFIAYDFTPERRAKAVAYGGMGATVLCFGLGVRSTVLSLSPQNHTKKVAVSCLAALDRKDLFPNGLPSQCDDDLLATAYKQEVTTYDPNVEFEAFLLGALAAGGLVTIAKPIVRQERENLVQNDLVEAFRRQISEEL